MPEYSGVTGMCYQLSTGKDWQTSLDYCPTVHPGAHLIDIHSIEENNVIRDFAGIVKIKSSFMPLCSDDY